MLSFYIFNSILQSLLLPFSSSHRSNLESLHINLCSLESYGYTIKLVKFISENFTVVRDLKLLLSHAEYLVEKSSMLHVYDRSITSSLDLSKMTQLRTLDIYESSYYNAMAPSPPSQWSSIKNENTEKQHNLNTKPEHEIEELDYYYYTKFGNCEADFNILNTIPRPEQMRVLILVSSTSKAMINYKSMSKFKNLTELTLRNMHGWFNKKCTQREEGQRQREQQLQYLVQYCAIAARNVLNRLFILKMEAPLVLEMLSALHQQRLEQQQQLVHDKQQQQLFPIVVTVNFNELFAASSGEYTDLRTFEKALKSKYYMQRDIIVESCTNKL